MSPGGGGALTPSNLEAGTLSPSPARDALSRNLDSSLTLNRKKSWFGSVRDTISRGAIHAKGYVDTLRGVDEQQRRSKAEEEENEDRSKEILDEEASIGQPASTPDGDSATPLRLGRPERQRPFTPKSAMSSLRQHIHTSKDRRARGVLADITGNEIQIDLLGPETFGNDDADCTNAGQAPFKGHAKKNSIGRSLVGSIRSIGKKSTMSKATSPTKTGHDDNLSPTKQAAAIPLPSSPINIPAPTLGQLDLGPSALMSTAFARSPETELRNELMALTDPSHQLPTRVPTYYTRIPGEGPNDRPLSPKRRKSPLTPGELLELPVDEFGFSIPEGPSTPMPGTNATLELDGASEDATHVFERSVESKSSRKRENQQLRKMASIDAMATQQSHGSPHPQGKAKLAIELNVSSDNTQRRISEATTVEICPTYMPPLTRQSKVNSQLAALQTTGAGRDDSGTGEWTKGDPFAPGNAVEDTATSGPPSPTRSVKLPLRPKIRIQSVDATEPRTWEAETMTAENIPKGGVVMMDLTKRSISEAPTAWAINIPWCEYETKEISCTSDFEKLKDKANVITAPRTSRKESSDYEHFKTQNLFGDAGVEAPPPDCSSIDDEAPSRPSSESSSSKKTVAPIYQRISDSQTPSPGRNRAGTTHSADVGDVSWKFNVKDWIQGSEGHPGTPNVKPSPRRLSEETSITCGSANGERVSPQVSPTVSSPNCTPSMGDRLDFETRRSERNMRYNALSDMTGAYTAEPEDCAMSPTIPISLRPALKLIIDHTSSGKRELAFANFDDAYLDNTWSSSPANDEPPSARHPKKHMSSDSIELTLKEAIEDNYKFQVAMAGIGPDVSGTSGSTSAEQTSFGLFQHHEADEQGDSAGQFSSPASWTAYNDQSIPEFAPLGSEEEGSLHETRLEVLREKGVINDYNFEAAAADRVVEDTLDEALEMFSRYNESKNRQQGGHFYTDDGGSHKYQESPIQERRDSMFSSPGSGYKADDSTGDANSPVSLKKTPARYRSRRGREV